MLPLSKCAAALLILLLATTTTTTAHAQSLSREQARTAALRLFADWLQAQQAGDLPRYLALYDEATFHGVKRTRSGDQVDYTFDAWRKNRTAMFALHPELAAEDVVAATWDEGQAKTPGLVEVSFVQRFRTPRYADHGGKILGIRCFPGPIRIVYEEMMGSDAGWSGGGAADRPKQVEDGTKLVSPIRLSWKTQATPIARRQKTQPFALVLEDKLGHVQTACAGKTSVLGGAQEGSAPVGLRAKPITAVAFAEADYTDWYVVLPHKEGIVLHYLSSGEGGVHEEDVCLVRLAPGSQVAPRHPDTKPSNR